MIADLVGSEFNIMFDVIDDVIVVTCQIVSSSVYGLLCGAFKEEFWFYG